MHALRSYVGRLLQRQLAALPPVESPLPLVYAVCHGFVVRAALESLYVQAGTLARSAPRNADSNATHASVPGT